MLRTAVAKSLSTSFIPNFARTLIIAAQTAAAIAYKSQVELVGIEGLYRGLGASPARWGETPKPRQTHRQRRCSWYFSRRSAVLSGGVGAIVAEVFAHRLEQRLKFG